MQLAKGFAAVLDQTFGGDLTGPLGLAVSGGSDSVALMYLAADWARDRGQALHVVTVDHGLREGAAAEAAEVARQAASLGLSHETLRWSQGHSAKGNLMEAARSARYGLMAEWAQARGIASVLLGHTRDDVAETLLMRLARGAGVDGLSVMTSHKQVGDVCFLRPLLSFARGDLRCFLTDRGVTWVDDPSNADTGFTRVRMRQLLATMVDTGIEPQQLAQSAQAQAQARTALNWAVAQFTRDHVTQLAGDLVIPADLFAELPQELQRRLLLHAVLWINGQGYGPRGTELAQFRQAALAGQGATLAGVRMTHRKGAVYLHREYSAVASLRGTPAQVFDNRWQLAPPDQDGDSAAYVIAPMGKQGLQACPNWRDSLRPAAAVMADPAVWYQDRLISAPVLACTAGWRGELAPNCRDFAKWVVSR